MVNGPVASLVAASNGVQQGCSISHFLFSCAMNYLLRGTDDDLSDGDVEHVPSAKVLDWGYADHIAMLRDDFQV